ncbi:MAG: 50S ribosomal protein L25/general stress protein Ctc [Burkholderiales bacterium]|nr:50S ribosomal protein L25/general stress protein Ctc [Burkholderiales bacterium]
MEVNALARSTLGKGASRRLRHAQKVPGVVYGGGQQVQSIELDHKALKQHLKMEAFHASILSLNIDGQKQQVLLRDYQMHPWRLDVLHVDFQRVAADRRIHMKVPLHFMNQETAPGVKTGGGTVSHVMPEIEIGCLPADLPEYIEVDIGEMQAGQSLHLSDLKLPQGVESIALRAGDDLVVVTIQQPRVEAATEEEPAAAAAPVAEKKPAGGDKK